MGLLYDFPSDDLCREAPERLFRTIIFITSHKANEPDAQNAAMTLYLKPDTTEAASVNRIIR